MSSRPSVGSSRVQYSPGSSWPSPACPRTSDSSATARTFPRSSVSALPRETCSGRQTASSARCGSARSIITLEHVREDVIRVGHYAGFDATALTGFLATAFSARRLLRISLERLLKIMQLFLAELLRCVHVSDSSCSCHKLRCRKAGKRCGLNFNTVDLGVVTSPYLHLLILPGLPSITPVTDWRNASSSAFVEGRCALLGQHPNSTDDRQVRCLGLAHQARLARLVNQIIKRGSSREGRVIRPGCRFRVWRHTRRGAIDNQAGFTLAAQGMRRECSCVELTFGEVGLKCSDQLLGARRIAI